MVQDEQFYLRANKSRSRFSGVTTDKTSLQEWRIRGRATRTIQQNSGQHENEADSGSELTSCATCGWCDGAERSECGFLRTHAASRTSP